MFGGITWVRPVGGLMVGDLVKQFLLTNSFLAMFEWHFRVGGTKPVFLVFLFRVAQQQSTSPEPSQHSVYACQVPARAATCLPHPAMMATSALHAWCYSSTWHVIDHSNCCQRALLLFVHAAVCMRCVND